MAAGASAFLLKDVTGDQLEAGVMVEARFIPDGLSLWQKMGLVPGRAAVAP